MHELPEDALPLPPTARLEAAVLPPIALPNQSARGRYCDGSYRPEDDTDSAALPFPRKRPLEVLRVRDAPPGRALLVAGSLRAGATGHPVTTLRAAKRPIELSAWRSHPGSRQHQTRRADKPRFPCSEASETASGPGPKFLSTTQAVPLPSVRAVRPRRTLPGSS